MFRDFGLSCISPYYTIGIKHGFSCINIRQVPWKVLKIEAEGECLGIEKPCSIAIIA